MEIVTKIISLLNEASDKGISVFLEEEKLKFKLAKGKQPDPEVIAALKENKAEILAFLSDESGNFEEISSKDDGIPRFDRNEVQEIPLSFAQQRLWFIDQLEGSVHYHMPMVIKFEGDLNRAALETAFQAIVNRQEILKTVYLKGENGQAFQQLLEDKEWRLAYEPQVSTLSERIAALVTMPFDLTQDFMLRANLLKTAPQTHILVMVTHHIASDGWSLPIFVNELVEFYQAQLAQRPVELADLSIQYADYALWQRSYLVGNVLEQKMQYWEKQLTAVAPLALPTDFARPEKLSTKGQKLEFEFDTKLTEELYRLSQAEGVTLFVLLLSVFKVLLYRYTGQEDICVGTPIANRQQSEVEPLLGFFVNTLAFRSQLNGELRFRDLLAAVKRTTVEGYANQDVPFEKIVDRVSTNRDGSRSPIFQVLFGLQNNEEITTLELDNLNLSFEHFEQDQSKLDLTFNVFEAKEGLSIGIEYCSDLFESRTIETMYQHYTRLLTAIVADPRAKIGTLDLLSVAEEKALRLDFNQTEVVYPTEHTAIELFSLQAARHPEKTAIHFEGKNYSYQTLAEKSNQLAHYLAEKGVAANASVGICLERSFDLVVSILAVQKLAATYIPIDPAYPTERINYILADAACSCLIGSEGLVHRLEFLQAEDAPECVDLVAAAKNISTQKTENLAVDLSVAKVAYIIYTSGSTGKPKGVQISPDTLLNLINWHVRYYQVSAESNATLMAGVGFDASVWELWPYLSVGASLYVVDNEERLSVERLLSFYETHEITHSFMATALVPAFVRLSRDRKLTLTYLLTGGDRLGALNISQLSYRIINNYGPTENTVVTSCYELQAEDQFKNPPIGKPIDNVSVYLLDNYGKLVPRGVVGELCIGGASLAIGYLNKPALTTAQFVDFEVQDGATTKTIRIYKTGDLARWLPDGNLAFLGRKDAQVKIRGYRIELGEIATHLQELPSINDCVVLTKVDASNNKRIVAYLIPNDGYEQETVLAHLKAKLPSYMLPSALVRLANFPLNANGKLDEKALPEVDFASLSTENYLAPRNEMEEQLVQIWQALLKVEKIGVLDNFFELGGHSILATMLVAVIRKELEQDLAIKDLFANPNIALLANHLLLNDAEVTLPTLIAQERTDEIPLSFAQERLWFIDQLEGSTHYHVPFVERFSKALDKDTLERALQMMVNRHEVLRTVFKEKEGRVYQEILPPNQWTLSGGEKISIADEATLKKLVKQSLNKVFDLSQEHPLRANLWQTTTGEYILVLVLHHIAYDGWSEGVFFEELAELYQALQEKRTPALDPLTVQYADYALWQRRYFEGAVLDQKMEYWKEALKGTEVLNLPTDFERPAIQSTKGKRHTLSFDADLSQALQDLAQREETTMFMLLLSAFKVLLYRYTGQEDIAVGSPVANRTQLAAEALIGFFVNTLVLRSTVKGETRFSELLATLKNTTLAAYQNQEVPFEKIVDQLVGERDLSRSPLFQVLFSYQSTPIQSTETFAAAIDDLQHTQPTNELSLGDDFAYDVAKYDLSFVVSTTGQSLNLVVEYCTDLFLPETIIQMVTHLENLLRAVVTNPKERIGYLSMLTEVEENKVLKTFNETQVDYPKDKTSVDLFEAQVRRTPQNIAVVFEGESLSYQALDERANQLARHLRNNGVVEESIVAICLERSIEMIVAMMGILKAGAAYLPIDSSYPQDRIDYLIQDSKCTIVVTSNANLGLFNELQKEEELRLIAIDRDWSVIEALSKKKLVTKLHANNLAYIIYTSGSTGKPKGVLIEHRSKVNVILDHIKLFEITAKDRISQFVSLSFDASVPEVFMSLLTGASLVLIGKDHIADERLFLAYIREKELTVCTIPPAYLSIMEPMQFSFLRVVMTGGEAADVKKMVSFSEVCDIYNLYGPTECSVCVSSYRVTAEDDNKLQLPIGKPISNTTVYILDDHQQLLPINSEGELYVGGTGLSRGYLYRPELTNEKFVPNPFKAGEKLYRTGDKAKWLPDGNISFLGRIDDQVKIRGHRIELGEIESVLQQSTMINRSVVLPKKDAQGNKCLVAYFSVESHYNRTTLEQHLKEKLPSFMLPKMLVKLDELPLTPNGKIDKKALPEPDVNALLQKEYLAPSNPVEKQLVEIWQDLLAIEKIGITDNFFELGGHSLLATRVVSAIRKELELDLEIKDLFLEPTIRRLAIQLSTKRTQTSLPKLLVQERPTEIPLSYAQERLWFIDKFEGSTHYHMPMVLRLKGALDQDILVEAFQAIVNRHEVLRTVYKEKSGEGFQVVLPENEWQLNHLSEKEVTPDLIAALLMNPFDLNKDHMLRSHLITTAPQEFVLVVVLHHIASDGWSMPIFIDELVMLYEAKLNNTTTNLPTNEIQYADFAIWQKNHLSGEVLENKLAYWQTKLAGLEALDLPTDYSRPKVQSNRGQTLHFTIPTVLHEKLRSRSQEAGVTMFMFLLSAFKVLLHKYTGQDDICVGTTIANRTQAEIEHLIGFFVNTLALRTQVKDTQSWKELLAEVKTTTLEAYEHQDVPFEKIVDRVEKGRDMSRSPLFQVLFEFQNNTELEEVCLGDVELSAMNFSQDTSKFDLGFNISDDSTALEISIEYCTDLFFESTIERMFNHYQKILTTIVEQKNITIGALELLLPEERALILGEVATKEGTWFNEGEKDLANDTPINLRFEKVARENPAAAAVLQGTTTWTYQMLNEYANQVGRTLQNLGVQPGDFVGVYLDRSPQLVACLLGIIKSGAAYVPLDTQNPAERIEQMVATSALKVMITDAAHWTGVTLSVKPAILLVDEQKEADTTFVIEDQITIQAQAKTNLPNLNRMDSWAYMLYTSGSTGTPKGAITRHNGALNHLLAEYEALDLADGFRFLQSAGIGSDISLWQMLAPLLKGGAMVIVNKYELLDYNALLEILQRDRIDIIEFVPSYIWGMVEHLKRSAIKPDLSDLKWIMMVGEAVPVPLVNTWKSLYPRVRILNGYGPCEASDDIAQYEITTTLEEAAASVPIGRPIANMNIVVLDAQDRLCPIGIPGELCVSGVGVGAGYWNMPEKTAASFIANPFEQTLGDVLYKTGDLAKWRADGNLEFLGRIDRQVKIRGHRVELGEIESFIRQVAGVKEAHILVYQGTENANQASVLAFIVATQAAKISALEQALQTNCQQKLPTYMQPQTYIFIEEIPLNLSDKVDEKALVNIFVAGAKNTKQEERIIKACTTTTEQALLTIWQNILSREDISSDDDFFLLGGHSLLAMRVKAAIQERLSVEINIRELFIHKTISALASIIDEKEQGSQFPVLLPQERTTKIPLSFAQERLWFVDQLEGSTHYHMPMALRFKGALDKTILEQAFKAMIERHEILRTIFLEENGVAYQTFLDADAWELKKDRFAIDISEEAIAAEVFTAINQKFDLSQDYPIRATLFECSREEHLLVLVQHHIVSDGWSEAIFIEELIEYYLAFQEQRLPKLAELSIQYADYAIWQRNYLTEELLNDKLNYWKGQLTGIEPLEMPLDFPRPVLQSMRGAALQFSLDPSLKNQLSDLAQREGVTSFMLLLSAFKVLLYRYSGQTDLCVGSPVADRSQEVLESALGCFVNTLAFRSDLSGNPSFLDVLHQVKTMTLTAYQHRDVPLEKIVDAMSLNRDRSRMPLFQVLFILQNNPGVTASDLGDLALTEETFAVETAKLDLTFSIAETEDTLDLGVEYCTDLFLPETIEQLVVHFEKLLVGITANPKERISELEILSSTEEEKLRTTFACSSSSLVPEANNLVALFEAQVARTPNKGALALHEEALTYQALNERANQLAHHLRLKGVTKETLVGVCINRSLDMVVAVLGILKAGGAYLPIDPNYPAERIHYLLDDSRVQIVLSNTESAKVLQEKEVIDLILLDEEASQIQKAPKTAVIHQVQPEDLAYVIYTSGSTGKPKGVMIEQRNAINTVLDHTQRFEITPDDHVLQFTSLSFDVSMSEIFMAFLGGARLVLVDKATIADTNLFINYLKNQHVNVACIPPGYLSVLDLDKINHLRVIVMGGEVGSVEQSVYCTQFSNVFNVYGPTECSVTTTAYQVRPTDTGKLQLPIGRPLPNTEVYILDAYQQLVPEKVAGEICIGGVGVGRGYLYQEELSKEKFIANPFRLGERLYRTGDKGKWLPDGNIAFLGRLDNQVKIRGHRIELGEIETILTNLDFISQCVVLALPDANKNLQLVAYYVPLAGTTASQIATIKAHLNERLPEYMQPKALIEMEAFTMTINDKVDKKALPAPDFATLVQTEYVAPRNETEIHLANIWQTLLKVSKVGIHDNFFELGGHSLLATRVVSAVRKEMAVEISIKDLFTYPNIAQLSDLMLTERFSTTLPAIVAAERPDRLPLSFAQERLWFIDKLEGSTHYHMPIIQRLSGNFEVAALEYAFQEIINRHEVLRTVFVEENGEAFQQILPKNEWHLSYEEQLSLEADALSKYLEGLVDKTINQAFNLAKDHMVRARLVKLPKEEYLLIVVLHHIASDGWSNPILFNELVELYEAKQADRSPQLKPLSIQYADYALWQRAYLKGEVLEQKLNYWADKLSGLEVLNLPTDFPRPAIQSNKGGQLIFELEGHLYEALNNLAQREGSTMFMLLLTVFKVLLHKHSGQNDIVVGTSIANRTQEEIEALIGFFVNTLTLRSDLSGNPSFVDLLAQIRTTTLAAYQHQDVPFEKIVDRVGAPRDMSRSPLFQVLFSYGSNVDVSTVNFSSATTKEPVEETELTEESFAYESTQFDLSFNVVEVSRTMSVAIEYCVDLFKPATIEKLMAHYQSLLSAILENPKKTISEYQILSEADYVQQVQTFNDTKIAYPTAGTLLDLWAAQVRQSPTAIALKFEDRTMSYQVLDEQSTRLAIHLNEQYDLQADDVVGLMMGRSDWAVVAILAILKTGAAYVPIDLDYPMERKSFIVEDTNLKGLIIHSDHLFDVIEFQVPIFSIDIQLDDLAPTTEEALAKLLASSAKPQDLAYLIYTSGSTGKPKGVMIEHRSLLNYLYYSFDRYRDTDTAFSFPLFTSLSFDLTQTSIFLSLLTGGTLCIEAGKEIDQVLQRIVTNEAINTIKLTPAQASILPTLRNERLKVAILGGDQLEKNQVEILRQINPDMRIFNEYGPTEATIGCTVYEVIDPDATILIGKPISNTEVYVLDAQEQLMPLGAAGELCVGGAGLARAYLNRPTLSLEKFIKHPFQEAATTRLYRTGDLAKWLPSGDLVYLGRIDDQVKIRGYRIELGEIENVLDACALVKEAIALPNTDVNGDKRLIAYVIPIEEFDQAGILDYLKNSLPSYMVPSLLIPLTAFPLTSNGKVDKKQLPDPDDAKQVTTVYTAARNEMEETLVQIWQELLNVEKVGVYDNFFELGGHSLLGVRVVSAIRNALQIEISIKDLFTHPNIDLLSNFMEQEGKRVALPPIIPAERPTQIPLSFSQERLWFIDKLSGSTHYHIPSVLRLSGTLDVPKLKLSFQRIVNRHEILRTVLRENEGQPHQVVLPVNQWEMSYETEPATTTGKGLEQLIEQAINQAFDLANDHMLRVKLIKLKEQEHILIFVLHHIASDGWSTPIFIRELMAFYSAQLENSVALLEDLPIQYADYAIWQRDYLQGDLLEEKLNYWVNKLRGAETLSLPIDLPRPSVQSTNGAAYYTQFDPAFAQKLQAIAQREGVTMFMLLLSAYKVMLHKYSDQYDISVGTPIANRAASEVENLIGFFVNTLVLRSDLSGNPSFSELVQRVKTTTLEAYDAQDVPFEKIVDRLVVTRDKSRSPLFQTMFIWQQKNSAEAEEEALTIGDLTLSEASTEQDVAKFDLSFNLNAGEDGVDLSVEYCTDLFLPATIEQMVTHYKILLEQIIENTENPLSELQLLDAVAAKEVVFDFNQTTVAYPADKTAVDLFMEQVALRGTAIAVQRGEQQMSYEELNERSNQLAHYLQKKNVKEEALVALCMDRSIDLMIAILAVLKAGGAYLPIDPTYPQQRIDYLIRDAKVKVVISDESYLSYFAEHDSLEVLSLNSERTAIAKEAISLPTTQLTPQRLMYVIYTSGSTGKPKGVMIEHTSNVNMALDQIKRFKITPQDNIVQFASIAFDASVYEIFMAFYAGASLVLVDQETIKAGEQFVDYLEQQAVTVATLPPAYLSVLDQSRLSFLRVMITAGESAKVMEAAHCASFSEYYNAYGPTECAVCVSTYKVTPDDIHKAQIPIGKALSNTALYVLDSALNAVPVNVEGEICVSGVGLARGYLYQEALTAEKFVAHPYLEGERLYRTGDRGKWLPDGNLIFLGRKDDQVKIRGHRIELEEIEMVLEQSTLVLQAAVLCRTATNGDKTLVAYLGIHPAASEMETEDCQRAITAYLESQLPNYMLPTALVCLDNLPLTTNGKIDKKALLELEATTWNRTPYLAPRNEMERQLVEIWQALLQVERVGVNDNFFEIGGHSLLAIRLMAQIDKRMGVTFPVATLFEAPTIAALAKQVIAQEEDKDEARIVKLKAGKGETAIFCVPGVEGDVMSFYELAKQIDEEQSLYAFQAQGLGGKQKPLQTVEAIAAAYIQAMQAVQPEGPYILGGYSFGAKVAYEMAVQLRQANQKVGMLSIFDAPAPHVPEKLELPGTPEEWMVGTTSVLAELYGQQMLELPVALFENKTEADQLQLMQEKLQALGIEFSLAQLSGFKAVFQQNALTKYTPKKQAMDIPIVLFETAGMAEKTKGVIFKKNNQAQWQSLSTQQVQAYTISGNHWTILKAPHVTEVAKYLQLCWTKELYAMKY